LQVFEEAGPELLQLHRSWVAFSGLLTMAPPGGLGKLIGLFADLLADIIDIGNAFLIFWNILTSPFELTKGWDAFLKRFEDIGIMYDLMLGKSPELETVMKPGEIATAPGAAGAAGRVQLDVNLRGNTDAVESATATSEGDVNFNMGPNFAY
jgi:hypothetical protein